MQSHSVTHLPFKRAIASYFVLSSADANPNGTTLLLDTVDVCLGAAHAAMAATSTDRRRRAF